MLFFLSGLLASASIDRHQSALLFLRRRLQRVLPGYIAVQIVMVAAGGMVSSIESYKDYVYDMRTRCYMLSAVRYLWFLSAPSIQLSLPGVFEQHKLVTPNPALWSLNVQIISWVLLSALKASGRTNPRTLLALTLAFASLSDGNLPEMVGIMQVQ
jgi:peptidoglycan/LPS O-acetylase OafA/YrhL